MVDRDLFMRTRQCDLSSDSIAQQKTLFRNKHVVAAGRLTWDAGSIPAASTISHFEKIRRACGARQGYF